jgi:hypothetical protein
VLLPNADRVFIDQRKLASYSLAPEHPVGGHKALLFECLLGITTDDADTLRDILLYVAARAEAASGRLDEFDQRYTIDFHLLREPRLVTVRSAWIVRPTEDFPRLTSCFIVRP